MTSSAIRQDILSIDLPVRPPEECKILVVDDDERIVEFLSLVLAKDGYQILPATDGNSALELIEREALDVAIMDVMLPGLDGIELCRRIKDNPETHFLPVILVTGVKARSRRLEGLHAGADEFINKPIDTLELVARVRSLLRTKQLNDEVQAHRRELEQRVAERTRELQAAYERLQELSRVKSNVLAIVSHELRTPLVQIKSALNLFREEGLSAEQRATLFRAAGEAFDLLEYRISDIEAFSDPSDLSMSPTSVTSLLAGAIEQVRILRRRQSEQVKLELPKSLPAVQVDSRLMTRALAHVIDNAVKFGKDRPVVVSASQEGTAVRVVIRDKGDGIPESVRPHIFEPLQQGEKSAITRRHGGMGIGLALVKMILDAHQVDIEIESEIGKGTTVSLKLPLAKL